MFALSLSHTHTHIHYMIWYGTFSKMYKINQSTNSALEVRRQLFCIPRINFHVLIISTDCYMLTAAKTTSFVVIFWCYWSFILYLFLLQKYKKQTTVNRFLAGLSYQIVNIHSFCQMTCFCAYFTEYVVHTYCHNF